MDIIGTSPQGMLSLGGNIISIENATIEEVIADTRRTGYLLISYEVLDQNNMIYIDQVRLNVGLNTLIENELGVSLSMYDLQKGMQIDAEFSIAMTRSIPPQSNAYRIIVLLQEPSENVTTDRVISVETDTGFLITGNPYDINDQMKFSVSNNTLILNPNGIPIPLEAIQPGQLVKVEHAIFQTMSIPPQSPAYRIQVL